jgi:hypothetical protein
MRLSLSLAALATLSACAAAAPQMLANPERIDLLENRLSVHFSDGSICRADIAAAPQGRLPGCATATDYAVVIHHKVWVQGAEPFMEPYATVTLTRAADGRRYSWQTPDGGEDHLAPNTGRLGN